MWKKNLTRALAFITCGAIILLPVQMPVSASEELETRDEITEEAEEQLSENESETVQISPIMEMESASSLSLESNRVDDKVDSQGLKENSYPISSQQEWDDLLSGVTDSANWSGNGTYIGTDDVNIILNCDITAIQDGITIVNPNVTISINLNKHVLSGSTAFTIKSEDDKETDYSYDGFNVSVHDGSISRMKINLGKSCRNVSFSNVSFEASQSTAIYGGDNSKLRLSVQSCHFNYDINDNDGTEATAIWGRYAYSVAIRDTEIHDYYTGLVANFMSAYGVDNCILNNITITGAHIGMDLEHAPNDVVVQDCYISGDGTVGSEGLHVFLSNVNAENFINGSYTNMDNTTIENVDIGIYDYSAAFAMSNSTIRNVYSGFSGSSGRLYVKDSSISASEKVGSGEYTGDSYGIYAASTGFMCINTKVSGFKIGAYNRTATSFTMLSEFDNIDVNLSTQCGFVYNCLLKNARMGVRNGDAYTNVVDTTITGTNEDGSIGVYAPPSGSQVLLYTKENYTNFTGDEKKYLDLVDANYEYITHKMEISNYAEGVVNDSLSFIESNGLEVKNCTTGMKSESNTLRTSNTVVHDCTDGVIAYSLFSDSLEAYNCVNTGVTVLNWFVRKSSASTETNLTTHDCLSGFVLKGDARSVGIKTYNNTNDGMRLEGTKASCYASVEAYDNGKWNINMVDNPNSIYLLDGSSVLTNAIGENINIDCNEYVFFSGTTLDCDNSVIYVKSSPMRIAASAPQWLNGVMNFDVPDDKYVPGTPVLYTVAGTVSDDLYRKTHFFAEREGWILKGEESTSIPFGNYQFTLAEGCEVTYDYSTNGGTSWSGDFDKIAYEKGNDVDLTYTATKPGYDFVGWSLTPNSVDVVNSLKAGTENITLYAVYRKSIEVMYHTWNTSYDFSEKGYLFNNSYSIYADMEGVHHLLTPEVCMDGEYERIGYTLDWTSAEVIAPAGAVIVCDDDNGKVHIYCIYHLRGTLTYKENGQVVNTEICEFNRVADSVSTSKYTYELLDGLSSQKGYVFSGWRDASNNLYAAGTLYETADKDVVLDAALVPIRVQSLVVNPKEANLYVGDTIQLRATVSPADALNPDVEWVSENPDIAKVDADGLVRATSTGTVRIYAYSKDNQQIFDYAVIIITEKAKENPSTTEDKTTTETSVSTEASSEDSTSFTESSSTSEVSVKGPITGDNTPVSIIGGITVLTGLAGLLNGLRRKKK